MVTAFWSSVCIFIFISNFYTFWDILYHHLWSIYFNGIYVVTTLLVAHDQTYSLLHLVTIGSIFMISCDYWDIFLFMITIWNSVFKIGNSILSFIQSFAYTLAILIFWIFVWLSFMIFISFLCWAFSFHYFSKLIYSLYVPSLLSLILRVTFLYLRYYVSIAFNCFSLPFLSFRMFLCLVYNVIYLTEFHTCPGQVESVVAFCLCVLSFSTFCFSFYFALYVYSCQFLMIHSFITSNIDICPSGIFSRCVWFTRIIPRTYFPNVQRI